MNTTANTKAGREQSRKYQFDYLIKAGYLQEIYKGLDFFTKTDGKYFTLKVFRGTAANHCLYMNYRTEERRSQIIENFKTNYESRLNYQAEQKEKNKGYKSSHAATAAAIRLELKKYFPFAKFSVTSESFAGGNSVHINWTDGATVDQVSNITNKYQYGSFNGMGDIYEYTNTREDIPQTKFVSESRTISEGIINEVAEKLKQIKHYTAEQLNSWNETPQHEAKQILYKTAIPHNYTGLKVIVNEDQYKADYFKIIFDTPEQETATAQQPQTQTTERTGKIQVIDYSIKAFAVIGDTKQYKEDFKQLGGSFNPRLNCGAGWIFSKKRLDDVKEFLLKQQAVNSTETEEETKQPEQAEEVAQVKTLAYNSDNLDILETPQDNKLNLEYFKIIWHEGRHIQGATFENVIFNKWEDVQKAFTILWDVNEKGKDGGYSKVKCEIKLQNEEAHTIRVDITNRIKNGDFNPSDMHIVEYISENLTDTEEPDGENLLRHSELEYRNPLNICDPESNQYKEALKEYEAEHPKKYKNIIDITAAAKSGKPISIYNLFDIVNTQTVNA